jgi:hypothetical protein
MMAAMASGTLRFNRHLPHKPIVEGELRYVELAKPGGPVRLYDFEYDLAVQLDGRSYAEIAESARTKLGMEVDAAQVEQFANSLVELGLSEDDAAPAAANTADVQWNPQGEPTAMMQGMSELLAVATRLDEQSNPELSAAVRMAEGNDSTRPIDAALADSTQRVDIDARSGSPVPPAPIAAALPAFDMPAPVAPAAPAGFNLEGLDIPMPAAAQGMPGIAAPVAATAPKSSSWLLWAVIAIIAAGAVGFAVWKYVLTGGGEKPVSVQTMVPSPESLYAFFEEPGVVGEGQPYDIRSPAAGVVAETLAVGAAFVQGDVIVLLEQGRALKREVDRLRGRVAYYQQLFVSMQAENNKPEARQAEIKLREKQESLSQLMVQLEQLAVVATRQGRVGAMQTAVGKTVRAQDTVVRTAPTGLQAQFSFPGESQAAAEAARLAFCRVEIEGMPCDCRLLDPRDMNPSGVVPDVTVELGPDCKAVVGAPVKLAKTRLDGVFSVPNSALVDSGKGRRIFVAAPTGRAEMRAVLLAEGMGNATVVVQGLDVGDAVIVKSPRPLVPNMPVLKADGAIR